MIPTGYQFSLIFAGSILRHLGSNLAIEPDYALSYYEDLTYRISANEIRTKVGQRCCSCRRNCSDPILSLYQLQEI
ncbi:MAG: hypothetical protein U5K51_09875 [Flavobacteriaceae bacterium]|nr:hypothetical protein [Flavobacteriaceae bacterium]